MIVVKANAIVAKTVLAVLVIVAKANVIAVKMTLVVLAIVAKANVIAALVTNAQQNANLKNAKNLNNLIIQAFRGDPRVTFFVL